MDKFIELITEVGYTNPKTIVVKFRRGLDPEIQNAIAMMAYGHPLDTSPTQWYDVARIIDQNQAANEAFRSAYKVPTPAPTCHFTTSIVRPPPPVIHANPTQSNPVPMDIDVGQRRNPVLLTCYQCNKSGHKAPDCPLRFDMRELTIEELQMELMTQMDIARVEASPLGEEEEVVQERDLYKMMSEVHAIVVY